MQLSLSKTPNEATTNEVTFDEIIRALGKFEDVFGRDDHGRYYDHHHQSHPYHDHHSPGYICSKKYKHMSIEDHILAIRITKHHTLSARDQAILSALHKYGFAPKQSEDLLMINYANDDHKRTFVIQGDDLPSKYRSQGYLREERQLGYHTQKIAVEIPRSPDFLDVLNNAIEEKKALIEATIVEEAINNTLEIITKTSNELTIRLNAIGANGEQAHKNMINRITAQATSIKSPKKPCSL